MDLVAFLGEFPVGDPNAMRRMANRLVAEADRILAVGDAASRTADSVAFEGPSADRFRGDIADIRGGWVSESQRVRATADYLRASALRLEHRQADWRRAAARLQRELAGRD